MSRWKRAAPGLGRSGTARAVAVLSVFLLSGCLNNAPGETTGGSDRGYPSWIVSDETHPELVEESHRLLPWYVGSGRFTAYEPSLGVTSDGSYFVAISADVVRIRDQGATWESVGDEGGAGVDADPWVWVDPTTDRVFHAALNLACSRLAWSDDFGETWTVNEAGGCGEPLGHFQKLTGGPAPPGVQTDGYPNILYYSTSSLRNPDPMNLQETMTVGGTGTWVTTSLDGGATWNLGTEIHPARENCYSQAGAIVVEPSGRAWSASQYCDGVRVARSDDGGVTWQEDAMLTDVGYLSYGSDPSLRMLGDELLIAYPGADMRSYLAVRSIDGEYTVAAVHPTEITSTIFTSLAVFEDVPYLFYYGTKSDASRWLEPDASFAPDDVEWHPYLTAVHDVGSLTWPLTRQPVQMGCIWMRGGFDSECRNQGDFMQVQATHDGVVAAFGDACGSCEDGTESRGAPMLIVGGLRIGQPWSP